MGPKLIERLSRAEGAAADVEFLIDFQLQVEHALDPTGRHGVLFVDAARSGAVAQHRASGKAVRPDEHEMPDGVVIVAIAADDRVPPASARAGDAILVSGTMGDHGVAIMASRESLSFETTIASDSAALHTMIADLLAAMPRGAVHVLRDPTGGGLASTLNEIAFQSGVGMLLEEAAIPVRSEVAAACELLGLDPMYVANEEKCIVICSEEFSSVALDALQTHPLGQYAARIGTITDDQHGFVQIITGFGGRRIVDWMAGEQLPRIC